MDKDKRRLCKSYQNIIKDFFALNNIKKVVCINPKEHFFDKIEIVNGKMRVCKGYVAKKYVEVWFDNLYFDFTCDYAVCLANMEVDLYLQERKEKTKSYVFTFNDK